MIDRLRRMAGRGEQPYKKWKKIAVTDLQRSNDNYHTHEV
jgi:hypothetical protein